MILIGSGERKVDSGTNFMNKNTGLRNFEWFIKEPWRSI